MAEVSMNCCDVCNAPMNGHDGRTQERMVVAKAWGLVLTIGFSENGWGHRRDAVNWDGVVCDACFKRAEAVFQAARAFLSGGEGQPIRPFYAVWPTEPQPKRRAASVLRSMRTLLSGPREQ